MKTEDMLAYLRGRADSDIRHIGYALTEAFEKLTDERNTMQQLAENRELAHREDHDKLNEWMSEVDRLKKEIAEQEGYLGIAHDFELCKAHLLRAAEMCAGIVSPDTVYAWRRAASMPNARCGRLMGALAKVTTRLSSFDHAGHRWTKADSDAVDEARDRAEQLQEEANNDTE